MYTYKVQPRGCKNTLLAWVFVLQCAFDVAWIECSSTDYPCQPTIVTSPSFHPRTTFDPYFAVTHHFLDILHNNVTHSISFALANQTGTKLFRGSSHGTHDFLNGKLQMYINLRNMWNWVDRTTQKTNSNDSNSLIFDRAY